MFFSTLAFAQEATQTAAKQPSMIENLIPFIFILVAMYFIMIRPQAKKAKEHSQLMTNLKSGDEIVTSGGIIGRVKSVADDFVTLDIGNTSLKILKEHVSRYTKNSNQVKAVKK